MKIVDGLALSSEHRKLLRPCELLPDPRGGTHRLPRWFYEIESWQVAKATKLTTHFALAELTTVDCREADLLVRQVPHYVPCAVSVLARYLQEFRIRVDAPIYVAVNGGYRSPTHRLSARDATPHHWGTAADVYRIGDTWLDSPKLIERYARVAESLGSEVYVKPFGHGPGETDDHLHLDLGFLTLVPHGCSEL
jgi:hypothetical protein